ncbi:hypothetical protein CARUB_v10019199mg [Capsella rubella]|uniref:Uncharacterized protein n=1 Tax=Capsella rubella TaxID=81985 RepID=R0FSK5_9BRAS|nr:hypothetical protein CARUB_v10019199mg [Capsella rubella]
MPSYISFLVLLFYIFLSFSSPRANFVCASRPLLEPNYPGQASTNTIYTSGGDQQGTFRGGSMINDCLPKGFHFNSAPSRYINNHPLGSTLCSTTEKAIPKP